MFLFLSPNRLLTCAAQRELLQTAVYWRPGRNVAIMASKMNESAKTNDKRCKMKIRPQRCKEHLNVWDWHHSKAYAPTYSRKEKNVSCNNLKHKKILSLIFILISSKPTQIVIRTAIFSVFSQRPPKKIFLQCVCLSLCLYFSPSSYTLSDFSFSYTAKIQRTMLLFFYLNNPLSNLKHVLVILLKRMKIV